MQINKDINILNFLTNKSKNCEEVLPIAEKLLGQHSILDNYFKLNYIDILGICVIKNPSKEIEYSYKVLQLTNGSIKERPTYTRNWLFQGVHAYKILSNNPNLDQQEKDRLFDLAYSSFEKTKELSPKRLTTYMGWAKTDMLLNKYDSALQKADECIAINPDFTDCLWLKSLIFLNSGKINEGTELLNVSLKRGYFHNAYSENILSQLINSYSALIKSNQGDNSKYYDALVYLYQEMIYANPDNFQYHASLAFIYKEIGQYDNARKEALEVIKLSPESKANVDAFLATLPK